MDYYPFATRGSSKELVAGPILGPPGGLKSADDDREEEPVVGRRNR